MMACMRRYQLQAAGWVDGGMHAQVRPLLEAMGRGVVELGDDPATAAAAKLVGNFMIISQASTSGGC